MLWGKSIKVFTNHANLMRDALGLTSDRVCQWRLLLEEYGPKIVYVKDIPQHCGRCSLTARGMVHANVGH